MDKFLNKYRIASNRAQWWDYGQNAAYFITICTAKREHFFGEIAEGKMVLSNTGIIADILWHEIPHHAPFIELGDFVVMPNHVHGILILNKPDGFGGGNQYGNHGNADDGNVGDGNVGDGNVETGHALSLQQQLQQPADKPGGVQSFNDHTGKTIGQQRFQNIGKNTVSSIIGSYKSAITKHANRLGLPNGWQTNYYDHIIRDDAEYMRISNYIINNPENWKNDKFNSGE